MIDIVVSPKRPRVWEVGTRERKPDNVKEVTWLSMAKAERSEFWESGKNSCLRDPIERQ
jgi:hypothetical protein